MADDRSTVNEAVSGDIIGLYDTGTLSNWGYINIRERDCFNLKGYRNLHQNYLFVLQRKM